MGNFRLRFILGSLLVHAFLGASLFFKSSNPPFEEVAVTISYAEPVQHLTTKSSPRKKSRGKLVQLLPKGLHAGNLRLKTTPTAQSEVFGIGTAPGSGGNDSEEIAAFTAPIQTLDDAVQLDPFYKALWMKLAAATQYPEDFSKHYISGSVRVRMEVDYRGVMTRRKLYVESENPYLETLVLFTILKTLKQPLDSKVWVARTTVPVTIHMNFIQKLPDDDRESSSGSITGHHLVISKYDYLQPELMKKIDDFMVKYYPPVIPVPGGFFVDFIRVYQMIKSAQEPDPNEMRNYRVEALEDAMERALIKEKDAS